MSWQVTLLAGVGAVVWYRRYRDAAVAIVPVYLAETLFWPYVNERRAILVLPLLAAWYVVGAVAVWQAIKSRISSHRKLVRARTTAALAVLLVVVVPLIPQMPRDYLFGARSEQLPFRRVALRLDPGCHRPPFECGRDGLPLEHRPVHRTRDGVDGVHRYGKRLLRSLPFCRP